MKATRNTKQARLLPRHRITPHATATRAQPRKAQTGGVPNAPWTQTPSRSDSLVSPSVSDTLIASSESPPPAPASLAASAAVPPALVPLPGILSGVAASGAPASTGTARGTRVSALCADCLRRPLGCGAAQHSHNNGSQVSYTVCRPGTTLRPLHPRPAVAREPQSRLSLAALCWQLWRGGPSHVPGAALLNCCMKSIERLCSLPRSQYSLATPANKR